jgi:hypothetical protein
MGVIAVAVIVVVRVLVVIVRAVGVGREVVRVTSRRDARVEVVVVVGPGQGGRDGGRVAM